MAEFFNALSAVFLIFSLMAVGYFLGVLGWMSGTEKKFISRFVVNVAVPMNCIVGVLNHLNRADLIRMANFIPVSVCTILLTLAVSLIAAKMLKLPQNREGIFLAMAFISNTLFIGLPLATQLFGEECIPFVMIYYMGSTVFTQTVAVMLCERAGRKEKTSFSVGGLLRDLVTKPPILGIAAAFLMLGLDVRPPQLAMSFAKYMSDCVTPLALLYCGFIVYELGIRNMKLEKGIPTMLLIRLIIAPMLCFGVCRVLGITGLPSHVFIVEAALPVVSQVTVMAGAYGADEQYAATGATLSTLGIFITVPFLMMLLT